MKSGNKNTIAILIKLFGGEIGALEAQTIGGVTPLILAASKADQSAIRKLLKPGASPAT